MGCYYQKHNKYSKVRCYKCTCIPVTKMEGAAPIERSIISGDKNRYNNNANGSGPDTGEILMQKDCQISERETADSLKNKLSLIGKELLIKSSGNREWIIRINKTSGK